MMSILKTSLIFTVVWAVHFQHSARARKYTINDLQVPGEILWLAEGDLDGNQENDLIFSYKRGVSVDSKKFLAIFFRENGIFPKYPQQAFQVPKNAVAFTIADVMGDEKAEIVYLRSSGIYAQVALRNRVSSPIQILKARNIVGRSEREDFIHWDFVKQFENRTWIIVPFVDGIELYERKGALYKINSDIELQTEHFYDTERDTYLRSTRGGRSGKIYAFRSTTVLPLLRFIDYDGDGKRDLISHFEDRISVNKQLKNGTFEQSSSVRRWFNLRTQKENAARDTTIDLQILDLNGDQIADISATKITGGVLNMRTETRLYLGQKGGGFLKKANQVFTDEGFASLVRYEDVDLDGEIEMIHPLAKPSLFSLSRVLLSSELKVDFRIRKRSQNKSFVFQADPDLEITSVLGLDFSTGGALHGPYPIFGIDINQDQKADIGIGQGDKNFEILEGEDIGKLQPNTNRSFEIKATRSVRKLHTKTKDASEILFYYKHLPSHSGRVRILTYR